MGGGHYVACHRNTPFVFGPTSLAAPRGYLALRGGVGAKKQRNALRWQAVPPPSTPGISTCPRIPEDRKAREKKEEAERKKAEAERKKKHETERKKEAQARNRDVQMATRISAKIVGTLASLNRDLQDPGQKREINCVHIPRILGGRLWMEGALPDSRINSLRDSAIRERPKSIHRPPLCLGL